MCGWEADPWGNNDVVTGKKSRDLPLEKMEASNDATIAALPPVPRRVASY